MRFLGSKFTLNALAAGAPTLTPLGELKCSPRPLADFRGPLRGRGKGNEGKEGGGKEKGVLGKGKREGREEGRDGEGKEEGKEGRGSLRHWL